MYEWLGISLALALLFALNTLVSLVVNLSWRVWAQQAGAYAGKTRARLLFALRVLPGLAAFAGATLLLLAYWVHEKPEHAETVSFKLGGLALISAAGLLLALWRGLAAWWTTRRLVKNWLQNASPIELPGVTIPALRLQHPFPLLAVVGLWRPHLFIAEQLLTKLTPDELHAALAHEMGHLHARDNLKRTALRACRDALMLVPGGRALDRAWDEATEEAADEFAAAQPQSALALAAALVKIARCAPSGMRAALPVQASFTTTALNASDAFLAHRVKRLLQLAETQSVTTAVISFRWQRTCLFSVGLLLALLVFRLSDPLWLAAIHELNEAIVFSLR
jgi:Zn-dependent protease with chaperone function